MKIALIGASGFIGSVIRDEALARGHEVTAIVRNPAKITVKNAKLNVVKADVMKDNVADLVKGNDAVISAYNAAKDSKDTYNDYVKGARAIIDGVKKAGIKRLLAVGGAGTLEIAPGKRVIDTMNLPEQIMGGIKGTAETLAMLKKEDKLDWTVLSPAGTIEPGKRTGKFRLGKDQLVKDDKGESKISVQDYAVALIDELEKPKHIKQRFTLAY